MVCNIYVLYFQTEPRRHQGLWIERFVAPLVSLTYNLKFILLRYFQLIEYFSKLLQYLYA